MFNALACLCHGLPAVSKRQRLALSLLGLLTLALGLAGCGNKDEIGEEEPIPIAQLQADPNLLRKQDDIGSIPTTPMQNPTPSSDLFRGVVPGAAHINPGFRGADADYIDKADVYWMLNYIRKVLLYGLPSNYVNSTANMRAELVKVVTKARKQLADAKHDGNYDLADEALQHLEKSIEHITAQQKLEAAYVSRRAIPWGAGSSVVQKFIDSGGLGFGKKEESGLSVSSNSLEGDDEDDLLNARPSGGNASSALTSLTPTQQEVIQIIQDYEKNYHAPPDQVMHREWKIAIDKINKLRDNLGLMNRDENKDGDSTETRPMTDSNLAETGVNGVVPIPEVGSGSSTGTAAKPSASNSSDPYALPTIPEKHGSE